MTDKPARAPQARTFVVRVVVDEQAGTFGGQASEPGSADEWRVAVSSLAELWDRLERRLTPAFAATRAAPPLDDEPTDPAG
jgi:hypothetical protein